MTTGLVAIVHNIFDEVQKSPAALKSCERKLHTLLENNKDSKDDVILNLFQCYDKVLLCAKREPAAERIVKFFSFFFAHSDEEVLRSGLE
jgi:hypothetical protein